jgi:hypothetical protein
LLKAPILILKNIGISELARYVWVAFSPWLFLPWLAILVSLFTTKFTHSFTRRIQIGNFGYWILAIAPSFTSAAISTIPQLRRPNFHYVLELWPILAGMTIVVLARLRSLKVIWIWAIFSILRMDHDPIGELREYWKDSVHLRNVRTYLQKLPQDGIVAAEDLAGTWVASRKWVSRWPDLSLLPGQCPEYVVLHGYDKSEEFNKNLLQVMQKCGFRQDIMKPSWQEGAWRVFIAPK